jgi:AsmA protein
MKRLLIVLGGLLVVVIAAVAALPHLLDVNRYHDRIQTELQKNLGREVQLGQMNLGVFPPTFKVQNAVIGEDPKFNSGMPFAKAAELNIRVKLQPLLHKDVQVESLQMVSPQVELIRGEDGNWNFSSLGTHNTQQTKQEQASGQNPPLQLDRFQINDGAVAITDNQKHQPRMEYSHIDLVLSNYAPGKPFDIAMTAHLPGGGGKQVVKFDGHGGPIDDATMVSTPFEGTLQLDQVMLSGAQQYTDSNALKGIDGSLGGNIKFKNDAGKVSAMGTLRLDNVVAHGKQLGFPIVLDYNASDDLKAEVITVSNTQLKLGSAPFVINGTVNGKSTPPLADLKLNAQNASIAELVKLAEAAGVQLSPGMNPSGQLTADLSAKGPLSGPAVAGTLRTNQLAVSGVTANTMTIGLNMAPSGADVVKTLTGRVTVNMNDGKLTGVDLSQKLGQIGKFTGAGTVANGATHVSQLSGTFDIKNGLATTNDLKALTDAGTVAATGTASLVDQGLDMKATAVLSKQSSQQVGGAGVGGMMTTAMANKDGELVIPVLVTGTIPSPKVEPDTAQMAKMKMSGMLPSFSNPGQLAQGAMGSVGKAGSGVSGMLGGLTGKKTPGATASNQQQNNDQSQSPASALGRLFGGKKNK